MHILVIIHEPIIIEVILKINFNHWVFDVKKDMDRRELVTVETEVLVHPISKEPNHYRDVSDEKDGDFLIERYSIQDI